MTDDALDFGDALTDPQAAQRADWRPCAERVGTSKIALARLALGDEVPASTPRYMRDAVAPMRDGHSRFLKQLAGMRAWGTSTPTMQRGTNREREILGTWLGLVRAGWTTLPIERNLDSASAIFQVRAPDCDRWQDASPYLDTGALDALLRSRHGRVVAEAKCARYAAREGMTTWWEHDEAPWWHVDQIHAELAIADAAHGILVVGCGWNRDDDDPRADGPIKTWHIERDEREIERVRDVARRAIEAARRIRALVDASGGPTLGR